MCIVICQISFEGTDSRAKGDVKPRGGGGALDFHVDGGGGAAGGRKPDPVAMRSVHKYTPCHNIPC